jgi:hypothetical protein
MGTIKLGENMSHYGNQAPQVGDLFVSETQGRLHILVSYEFVYKDRVDFYNYYDVKLKRLDDGASQRWKVAQHEFYRKYKPLVPDPQT